MGIEKEELQMAVKMGVFTAHDKIKDLDVKVPYVLVYNLYQSQKNVGYAAYFAIHKILDSLAIANPEKVETFNSEDTLVIIKNSRGKYDFFDPSTDRYYPADADNRDDAATGFLYIKDLRKENEASKI